MWSDFDLCMVMIVKHQWSIQSRSSASTTCRLWFVPQESRALLGRPHISIMGTARRRAIWRREKVVQDPDSERKIDKWLFLIIRGFVVSVSQVLWGFVILKHIELYRMCWVSSRFGTIFSAWSYSVWLIIFSACPNRSVAVAHRSGLPDLLRRGGVWKFWQQMEHWWTLNFIIEGPFQTMPWY